MGRYALQFLLTSSQSYHQGQERGGEGREGEGRRKGEDEELRERDGEEVYRGKGEKRKRLLSRVMESSVSYFHSVHRISLGAVINKRNVKAVCGLQRSLQFIEAL